MKLLAIILPVIGLAGGLAGGHFLAPPAEEPATGPGGEEHSGEHGGEVGETHSDPADAHAAEPNIGDVEYAKLSRQFIVPVIEEEKVSSLIVVNLAVEVGAGETSLVAENEPKLRDVFLRVLFNHAQSGGFSGKFTSPEVMNDLRASLDQAARKAVGGVARRVLVTNIVRQDY